MRVLFSFAGGEGHLQPLLPLARAAAAAGHEVLLAGAASLAPVAEAAGLLFAATPPDVVPRRTPLRALDFERELQVVGERFAGSIARERTRALLELCSPRAPEVLVRDELDFGAAVAAERLAIPAANVIVAPAGRFVRPEIVSKPLARLREEHGLDPRPGLAALARELVLAPFPPRFRDPQDPLPPGTRAFRPFSPRRAADLPARPAGRPPFLHVTLGTIFNTESGDLLSRVVAGARSLGLEVVVTVGRTMDPRELGAQPDGVHVERHLPLPELLPHCAAVICHAGSGTIVAALAHGLPLVCIPLGADQPLNAARCAALGAGVILDAMTLTPGDVRVAARRVLEDPGPRRAVARLQAELSALPGPAAILPPLELLAEGAKAGEPEDAGRN